MTQNNSGGVAKYDGQPINTKPAAQNGESLDDIVTTDEVEQPVRKNYTESAYKQLTKSAYSQITAPKYAPEKK